jgi:hypothetical protein
MYFNPVTKRVHHLYRMRKGVACCDFDDCDTDGSNIFTQAEECLRAKGENDAVLHEFLALPFFKKAMRTRAIDIIREHGKLVTRWPTRRDQFKSLIVTVGSKQYSIYAEEAKTFRDCCFIPKNYHPRVEILTRAYILHSHHERNWATVIKSARFKLPAHLPK